MTEGIKILITVDEKTEKWIDERLKEINKNKDTWQRKANRQSLIRACIQYAILMKPEWEGRYGREVYLIKRSYR